MNNFNYSSSPQVSVHGNPTLINARDKSGCDLGMLGKIIAEFDYMLNKHCKVLVIRFELFTHTYLDNNRVISNLMHKANKRLISKKFGLKDVGYAWCREIDKHKNTHYHIAFFINGSQYRSGYKIQVMLEKLCNQNKSLNLRITSSNPNTQLVRRGDSDDYAQVIWWLSYLTKARSKEKLSTICRYSTSRNSKEILPIYSIPNLVYNVAA